MWGKVAIWDFVLGSVVLERIVPSSSFLCQIIKRFRLSDIKTWIKCIFYHLLMGFGTGEIDKTVVCCIHWLVDQKSSRAQSLKTTRFVLQSFWDVFGFLDKLLYLKAREQKQSKRHFKQWYHKNWLLFDQSRTSTYFGFGTKMNLTYFQGITISNLGQIWYT